MNGDHSIKKAFEAILSQDYEDAITLFEKALQAEPSNASYHYRISITYARSNKLSLALKHAQLACQLEPNHKEYSYHLQHVQARELIYQAEKYFTDTEDELRKAISLLEQAVCLDPLVIEAFLLLGLANANLQHYHEALSAVEEALKLDPQHVDALKLKSEVETKLAE